jgi:hypothetical protein
MTVAANARGSHLTTQANIQHQYLTGLALAISDTQESSFLAAEAMEATANRQSASWAASLARLDAGYWSNRAADKQAVAQSLATSIVSPWTTHYVGLMSAMADYLEDTGPAYETLQAAVANADAGLNANGSLSGGGRIALAQLLRELQVTATQEQEDEADSQADAGLEGTQGAGEDSSAVQLPRLQTPGSVQNLGTLLGRSHLGVVAAPDGSAHVKVEDGRQWLQRVFGGSASPTTMLEVIAPDGVPKLVAASPLTGLPEGFKVDTRWTAAEIERAAASLALGGKAGPMTTEQMLEFQRYQSLIWKQIGLEHSQQMRPGQQRDAMIAELIKRFDPYANDPMRGSILVQVNGRYERVENAHRGLPRPNYESMTFEQLKQELAKHLPAGADVEQWLNEKIAQDYLDWLQERRGQLAAADSQKVLLDLIQLGLDIGGIFDPTGIADAGSAAISLGRGELLDAGINVVSMFPWIGDAAKLLKIPKYIATVQTLVSVIAHNPQVAVLATPLLKKSYDILNKVPWDQVPESFRKAWQSLQEELWKGLKKSDDVAKKYTDEAIAAKRAPDPHWKQSKPSRAVLNERLGGVLGDELDAHHIVAGDLARAAPARQLLDKYQIDINDPANGVLLKGGPGAPATTLPRRHRGSGLHSHRGVDAVTRRLEQTVEGVSDWGKARQLLLNELGKIGSEIKSGSFP